MPHLIGIDEAGRGPLAGPVVVAGVRIPPGAGRWKLWRTIRDSKKLTARQREIWFQTLTCHPQISWAVARVWPRAIERMNVARAADLAVLRVYYRLCARPSPARIELDAGLSLPRHIPHQTIPKGDERIPWIAAASIIAKVTRDRTMRRLHRRYPQYRFDRHKGYGTALHRELLRRYGHSPVHRVSFLRKILNLQ